MKEENKNVGAEATIQRTGAIQATETHKTFDELLQDKEYQSAYDKKLAKALETARINERKKIRKKLKENQIELKEFTKKYRDIKEHYELKKEKSLIELHIKICRT